MNKKLGALAAVVIISTIIVAWQTPEERATDQLCSAVDDTMLQDPKSLTREWSRHIHGVVPEIKEPYSRMMKYVHDPASEWGSDGPFFDGRSERYSQAVTDLMDACRQSGWKDW